jgi:ribonuclease G
MQRKLASVIRRIRAREAEKDLHIRILVNPGVLERLRSEDADLLVKLEKIYNIQLTFRADPNYHVESFKILNAETGEELRS